VASKALWYLVAREKCRNRSDGMISQVLQVFDIACFGDFGIDFLAI
jgi:hypothetical protein